MTEKKQKLVNSLNLSQSTVVIFYIIVQSFEYSETIKKEREEKNKLNTVVNQQKNEIEGLTLEIQLILQKPIGKMEIEQI